MKLLKCISAFCSRSSSSLPNNVVTKTNHRIYNSRLILLPQTARQIHQCAVAHAMQSKFPNSNSEIPPIRIKFIRPQAKSDIYLNDWFYEILDFIKTSSEYRVDWENAFIGKQGNFPLMALSKIVATQTYHAGLYENGLLLLEYIEKKFNDGKMTLGSKDIIFLTAKISLNVHQKKDYEQAIAHFDELLRISTQDGDLVLDSNTCSTLIAAISNTSRWKDCIKLMEIANITRQINVNMCTDILVAALKHNDDEVVRKIIADLDMNGEMPGPDAFEAMLMYKPTSYLMNFLTQYKWIVDSNTADIIKEYLEKSASVEKIKLVSRTCPCCNNSFLPSSKIPHEDMDKLVKQFDSTVFIRNNDLFMNSNPQEVDRFKEFMKSVPKHDVVIDALNILYQSRNMGPTEENLLYSLIHNFVACGKRVIVIGRSHLKNTIPWFKGLKGPNHSVDWFFLDNQSQDDIFFIYAALHGNDGCIIVTRDELRNHKSLLGFESSRTFGQWQRKYQVTFEQNSRSKKKLMLRWPPKHEVIAQTTQDGTIHIPFMDETEEHASFSHSDSWLCIKKLNSKKEIK